MNKTETWKDVIGWEGWYEVSDLGHVRSLARLQIRKNGSPHRKAARKLPGTIQDHGYRIVSLRRAGRQKVIYVHRLVAMAFLPNPENKKQVNHRDGVRHNNILENLEWATSSENLTHSYRVLNRRNEGLKGEANGTSVLRDYSVKAIRRLYIYGSKDRNQRTIARLGFREADVLAHARGLGRGNCQGIFFQGQLIPVATEIHHRNKARGPRKTDVRFWISSSRKGHGWIEDEKKAARAAGFLLPLEADQDGRLPDGTFGLQTPAFMLAREGLK